MSAQHRFAHGDKVRHKQTKKVGKVIAVGSREYYGEDTYAIDWIVNAKLTQFERGVPGDQLELDASVSST